MSSTPDAQWKRAPTARCCAKAACTRRCTRSSSKGERSNGGAPTATSWPTAPSGTGKHSRRSPCLPAPVVDGLWCPEPQVWSVWRRWLGYLNRVPKVVRRPLRSAAMLPRRAWRRVGPASPARRGLYSLPGRAAGGGVSRNDSGRACLARACWRTGGDDRDRHLDGNPLPSPARSHSAVEQLVVPVHVGEDIPELAILPSLTCMTSTSFPDQVLPFRVTESVFRTTTWSYVVRGRARLGLGDGGGVAELEEWLEQVVL